MDADGSAPVAELESLTHALSRHVARRAVMGIRRLPRTVAAPPPQPPQVHPEPSREPPAPERAIPGEEQDLPTRASGSAPNRDSARTPTDAPGARSSPDQAPGTAPWPGNWGTTPSLKDETENRVEAMAARAQAAPDLAALAAEVAGCNACSLCQTRSRTVFADGTGSAGVLFVGEAPGYHEDREGLPFVGRAGALLTDIIQKGMGLQRSEVMIANVLKCRPPENRDPSGVEKRLCTVWLERQIELANPRVIVALGRHAAGHLLSSDAPMNRLRGRVWERDGRKVVATYHPAFLLRSPQFKRDCWQDVQLAMGELGLDPPGRPDSGSQSPQESQ